VSYHIKELYFTMQGEGARTGWEAVFCRFTGCNLWSGLEQDRATATCTFCDTDFVGTDGPGGGVYSSAGDLAAAARGVWDAAETTTACPYVVCTGGEPLLQMDEALVESFHARGFAVAVETNGTKSPPAGIDWICVSPKLGADLVLRRGQELKFVYPQNGGDPAALAGLAFENFSLQPMDGPQREQNTERAAEYCRENPRWKLSIQVHKYLGIP
jgi:7-carboxy-7-deazaguanine synthase (Cx14CxxC type)